MPDNYFVLARRQTKIELLNFLKKNCDEPLEKALAQFSFKTGFKVTLLKAYVDELVLAGYLKVEHDQVINE